MPVILCGGDVLCLRENVMAILKTEIYKVKAVCETVDEPEKDLIQILDLSIG